MPPFDPFAASLPGEDSPEPPSTDLPRTTEPPSDSRSTPPSTNLNPNDTDPPIPHTTSSHDFAPSPTFNPENSWGIQAALSGVPGVEIEDNRVPRPPRPQALGPPELNYPPHPLNYLDLSGAVSRLPQRLLPIPETASVGEGDGTGYRTTRFSEGSGNLYPPMEEDPEAPEGFWEGGTGRAAPIPIPIPGERERGRGMERRMEVGRELNERTGLGSGLRSDLTFSPTDTSTSSSSPGLFMARPGGRTVADRVREEEAAERAREQGLRRDDVDVDVYAETGMAPGLGVGSPESGPGSTGLGEMPSPNFEVAPWSPVISSGAITTGEGSEEGVAGRGAGVEAGELGWRLEAAARLGRVVGGEVSSAGISPARASPDVLHSALSPPADRGMSRQSMMVPGVPVGVTEMPTGLDFGVERAISALDEAVGRLDRRTIAILQGIRVAFPGWFDGISETPHSAGAAVVGDVSGSRVGTTGMGAELRSILPRSPPPPMDFRTAEARDAWMATQFRVLSAQVVEDLAPMEEELWGVGPLQGLEGVGAVSREREVIRVRGAGERVRSALEPLRISHVVEASSTHVVRYPSLTSLSDAERAERVRARIFDPTGLSFPEALILDEVVPSAATVRTEPAREREFTPTTGDPSAVQRYELNPFYAAGLTRPPLQTSELTNQLRGSPTAASTSSTSRGSINATPISPHTGFPEISAHRAENVAPTTPVQYPDLSRHMLQGPVPGGSVVERLGSDDITALQRDSLRGSATMADLVKRRREEDGEVLREREGGSPPKKRMEDE
ncbi:hypothetical protein LTR56_021361 [Elasticomyces elasticus]|nr:hypothetical protein LTR22_026141 [Elasticomyces elasticus]KAK3623808.1 hypothetical protein LTR56_021361 [Elasticomyces elasticus]KAK4921024.1 hypothetical protein LTR49_011569 [Elasticomyces elasticus]KAK5759471.1 hypothetical protein LTS12_010328 [Elasticomyces elasticus]